MRTAHPAPTPDDEEKLAQLIEPKDKEVGEKESKAEAVAEEEMRKVEDKMKAAANKKRAGARSQRQDWKGEEQRTELQRDGIVCA
jgi:hypothetical protein